MILEILCLQNCYNNSSLILMFRVSKITVLCLYLIVIRLYHNVQTILARIYICISNYWVERNAVIIDMIFLNTILSVDLTLSRASLIKEKSFVSVEFIFNVVICLFYQDKL